MADDDVCFACNRARSIHTGQLGTCRFRDEIREPPLERLRQALTYARDPLASGRERLRFRDAAVSAASAVLDSHDARLPVAGDELYLALKGARERLCVAQVLVDPSDSALLGGAIDRVDLVAADLPGWSRHDGGRVQGSSAP